MNISISNNIKPLHMNSITSISSNADRNPLNSLNKQKDSLQNQIKEVSENKDLSPSEKTQKLNELQKQMDELNTQIGKQKLEDIKNSGKELAENIAKKAEKATTNEERKENVSIALNYSLISASKDNNDVKKLNGYRKIAIKEDSPNSDRVNRIDSMINDKQKNIKKNLAVMAKAVEEYSKNNKKELEDKIREKITKYNNIATQYKNTDVKIAPELTNNNINEIVINASNTNEP